MTGRISFAIALIALIAAPNFAQDPARPPAEKDPAAQVEELKARVAALEEALARARQEEEPSAAPADAPAPPTLAHAQTALGLGPSDACRPGIPGASHTYHVGAVGFFLDQADLLDLLKEQQAILRALRTRATLKVRSLQRRIDEAEQELWVATCAETPDAGQIEAKVRAIEKLRADQRLTFIEAVAQASKVLTEKQRRMLLGTASDEPE